MITPPIRIGTRESQLALWQAEQVQQKLLQFGYASTLVPVKSEGDIDLHTPLYEIGIQGIFTRSLDIALLNNHIDMAVHSMKDVPTRLPEGIAMAAVLERGPVHDLLVYHDASFMDNPESVADIATSSIRRKAQWLARFPHHRVHNLRGNVNTRLRKLESEKWNGAIFAQAGLERIGLRPQKSLVLDWMLPAPAQGAILVVCRSDDHAVTEACRHFHDAETAACTLAERDFLRELMGGCSTPISALATMEGNTLHFRGNIFSPDGKQSATVEKRYAPAEASLAGAHAARELLQNGGKAIAAIIQNAHAS